MRVLTLLLLTCFATNTFAQTITTGFDNATFPTGSMAAVTIPNVSSSFTATFSGGQQQQMFDGPSYNMGNDAYLFINGTFNGVSDSTDVGSIVLSMGATTVSFYAANRANGNTATYRVLDVNGVQLDSQPITATSNQPGSGGLVQLSSATLGGLIGSIEFDNAGPAPTPNPPYVIAIDSFTAVPEPSAFLFLSLPAITIAGFRRYAAYLPWA